jgi:antitoxin component YwqK of YwqJK toxin-antitoxin module
MGIFDFLFRLSGGKRKQPEPKNPHTEGKILKPKNPHTKLTNEKGQLDNVLENRTYSKKSDTQFKSKLRIHTDKKEIINGTMYYEGKPFTGIYYSLYPNGKVSWETEQLNGVDHGVSKRYNSDGTIHSIVNFSNGEIHKEDNDKNNEFLRYYLKENIVSIIPKQTSDNKKLNTDFNNKVWNKKLHITKPDELSLVIPTELQKTEFWNYFIDDQPYNGVVYYLYDERDTIRMGELMMISEEERLKLIEYEFDVKNGVKDGKCRLFDENQTLTGDYEIKNDVKNGIERGYSKDDTLTYECVYKNNERNGFEKGYRDNGTLEYKKEWINGVENGVLQVFYENGKLEFDGTLKNGIPIEKRTCWDENGKEIDCSLTRFG